MSASTKEVYFIFITIVLILGGVVVLDWSRLFQDPIRAQLSPITEGGKLTIAYLTTLLAWRSKEPSKTWSMDDATSLRVIFTLIAIADTCFIAHYSTAGIYIFMAVQTLFIRRHLTGYGAVKSQLTGQDYMLLAMVWIVTLGLSGLNAAFFWYPRLGLQHPVFITLVVYFCLKCTSVMAAYAAVTLGQMPLFNSYMVAMAMTSFFICDHTVTGNLLFDQEKEAVPYIITSSLTWMFYGPALILLSLSSYRQEVLGFPEKSTTKKKE